ncbi:translesion error-prone DNA polymerase V autoproteolytic subunit [Prochlorococcus sp. MIT 1341]|uniref:LexA family protein n=1 Tax=Prochlorococcus sp. MIT 1341 TaxID=3096221 RepID=UPI002A754B5C|nr:translesion error-prone DNA polymerase V autoproteolytic subunit [Prochlorococcus sp. MIT 1341]
MFVLCRSTMEISGVGIAHKGRQPIPHINKEDGNTTTGFPSPADDYAETGIDLNKELIPRPTSTFFLRVSGESMNKAGIYNEDLLIVDRSINAKPGDIVITIMNGVFTIKRLTRFKKNLFLEINEDKQELPGLNNEKDIFIWGVVTYSIHRLTTLFHQEQVASE